MNNKKDKRILVMCLPDPSGNPRPRRAVELCKYLGFTVDIISAPVRGELLFDNHFQLPGKPKQRGILKFVMDKLIYYMDFKFRKFIPGNYLKSWVFNYKNNFLKLRNVIRNKYDLIIVEDLDFLPLAFTYKGKARLVFDAREYYLGQKLTLTDYEKFNINWICREYLPKSDTVLTVSNGLAREYKKVFGIDTVLIRSMPNFQTLKPTPVDPNRIKIVHHGVAENRRKIENLIKIFELLDQRFSLDLYLFTGNKKRREDYLNELKKMALNNSRIRFFEPVPYDGIIAMLNNYDIGLLFFEPTTFNLKFSLPNKFFEFIQARLMVAIGPSPDMADLVRKYGFGIVSEKFDLNEMARLLNNMSIDDITEAKRNSHLAAKELCFEEEGKRLINIIESNLKD